jgi:hypothetical protein
MRTKEKWKQKWRQHKLRKIKEKKLDDYDYGYNYHHNHHHQLSGNAVSVSSLLGLAISSQKQELMWMRAYLGLDFKANFYHTSLISRIRKQYVIWNGGTGNSSVGTVTTLCTGQLYNRNSIPAVARDFFSFAISSLCWDPPNLPC